jgi:purine-binding chemotaxis protein CheW
MREEDEGERKPAWADPNRSGANGIDWARIHQRLEASQAALERRLAPGREERQATLRARARLLAREPKGQEEPTESLEVVEFLLAYERYAIESRFVREIYPLRDFTPLPCTPPFVLGLINVRGQIVSIIDVKKFFDLPEKGLADLNKVIVVETERMELGILADAVLGVQRVAVQDLQPSLPTLTGIRAQYLRGVTKDSLVVLDVEKILSDGRIVVDEDVSNVT